MEIQTQTKNTKIIGLTLTLIFSISLFATSVEAGFAWNIQTVDPSTAGPLYDDGYCPIIVDSNNGIHVVYTGGKYDSEGFFAYSVRYAYFNGSTWSTQELCYGTPYSIALAANNNPSILYEAYHTIYQQGGLIISSWTGNHWNNQTIDQNDATYASLAIDNTGTPQVAYINNGMIKYAKLEDSHWTIQTIDSNATPYSLTFIALDQNNNPYILYYANTLKLASYKNGEWNTKTIFASEPTADYGNLAIDSKGNPHFICSEVDYNATGAPFPNKLLYVSWNGKEWFTQTVSSNIRLSDNDLDESIGSLSLDKRDNPHICYNTNTRLGGEPQIRHYASWTGSEWNTQTIDKNESVGGQCYLALDSAGNPHISYVGDGYDPLGHKHVGTLFYTTGVFIEDPPTNSPLNSVDYTSFLIALFASIIAIAVGAVIVVFVFRKH